MTAEELLRDGKLDEAFAELKRMVQKDPADARGRVFLFQILAVLGKWESATTQLDVSGELDPQNLAMVQAYRQAILCEVSRARVFAGESSPTVFGEPDRWLALLIEAVKLEGKGNPAEANKLRAEAFESAPATSGKIEWTGSHSADFDWIADADSRLGPVLEVLINGQYYWLPFHRVASIEIEAPADLRDFVWMPAHFTFANGGEMFGMIPTRYPGSDSVDEALIRLARRTEWQPCGSPDSEQYAGLGQRMLSTNVDDYALLDIRKITLNVESEGDSDSESSGG